MADLVAKDTVKESSSTNDHLAAGATGAESSVCATTPPSPPSKHEKVLITFLNGDTREVPTPETVGELRVALAIEMSPPLLAPDVVLLTPEGEELEEEDEYEKPPPQSVKVAYRSSVNYTSGEEGKSNGEWAVFPHAFAGDVEGIRRYCEHVSGLGGIKLTGDDVLTAERIRDCDLFNSVRQNQTKAIHTLLAAKADPNVLPYDDCYQPLVCLGAACMGDNVETARALLDAGADVNEGMPMKQTSPLNYCLATGKRSLIKLLLEYDPDISIANIFGKTPFHYAVELEDADLVASFKAKIIEEDGKEAESHLNRIVEEHEKSKLKNDDGEKEEGGEKDGAMAE